MAKQTTGRMLPQVSMMVDGGLIDMAEIPFNYLMSHAKYVAEVIEKARNKPCYRGKNIEIIMRVF